mmetsp:Transcript_27718/g.51572  ORF Transcript_27718/g.51572 Transcript_27718/m.51572 type:complete len:93 (+) Transcript_27718:5249-5527(+)
MSSTGKMITWLRTPTRPFSRRNPWKVMLEYFDAMVSGSLPAFGFAIVSVDVRTLGDVGDDLANIFSVFDCGASVFQVGQRDLVPNRHVVPCC